MRLVWLRNSSNVPSTIRISASTVVVGTTLLMWMMRHGEATKVTALVLLAPPLAAVQAYIFFGETLSPVQFVGFALALVGVLLARSARTSPK